MNKFKLGFLKSSASSTDKSLDNIPESSCGGTPKAKRFFTLRRKRNDGESQPLVDLGQEDPAASPPRAVNPLAEVAAALEITPSKSTSPTEPLFIQRQPQQQESPAQAEIQASRQTGGQLVAQGVTGHFETTERVAAIEALDSMEKDNQLFQESGRKTLITKTQEGSDKKSGINLHGTLPFSHSSPSILASKIAGSPRLSSRSDIARRTYEHLQIQSADQRYEVSKFRHVLEVLQHAARRIQADQSISQPNIFRSLVPLAIFLYLLGVGVLIPQQQRYRYRYSRTLEDNISVTEMIVLFFIGMASTLVVLRGMVWLVSVFGKAFCEVDLAQTFRRGECVDVDGRGMGEAELIVGGMFM
ncbi:hypothetical protein BYT27DRAFT_7203517 [Phlegmacium glaucopus]|nr:hypothetical protein BYT27DRAFT_7203517 [Phlegmacium glaucopus]